MRCMTRPGSKSTASSIRNALVFLLLIRRSWPPMSESAPRRSVAEAKVIEANVAFYLQMAEKYDTYEPYLFDPALQQSLEDDLDKIGSQFALLGRAPVCLEILLQSGVKEVRFVGIVLFRHL